MTIQDFIADFAAQFDETDTSEFVPELRFRELDEWSSLQALMIMAMAKTDYDVTLSAQEMRSANTLQELYDIVCSHIIK